MITFKSKDEPSLYLTYNSPRFPLWHPKTLSNFSIHASELN